MLEGGDPNVKLGGHESPEDNAALQQTFYCLRLTIYSMLERGEPNAMLGVIKARRVSAASQQTLIIVSGSPSHPILGEVTQRLYLEDELVLQEIFFDYVIEQSHTWLWLSLFYKVYFSVEQNIA